MWGSYRALLLLGDQGEHKRQGLLLLLRLHLTIETQTQRLTSFPVFQSHSSPRGRTKMYKNITVLEKDINLHKFTPIYTRFLPFCEFHFFVCSLIAYIFLSWVGFYIQGNPSHNLTQLSNHRSQSLFHLQTICLWP